jgi:hypothetical protein
MRMSAELILHDFLHLSHDFFAFGKVRILSAELTLHDFLHLSHDFFAFGKVRILLALKITDL